METLTMSKVERRRLEVVSQVRLKKLTLQKGSELLGIGYRQMKRLWSRYQAEGDAGLPRVAWQAHQVDSRAEAGEDSSVAWPWPTFLPDSR